MTAVAVKVESVRNLVPSSLTLKDTSCKPVFSDGRFAYFSFSVDSCGTTRTVSEPHLEKCAMHHMTMIPFQFFSHYVMYENEIGHFYSRNSYKRTSRVSPTDPEYR